MLHRPAMDKSNRISVKSETGELLIWPFAFEDQFLGGRKQEVASVFGAGAAATSDELKGNFTPLFDAEKVSTSVRLVPDSSKPFGLTEFALGPGAPVE